jgi:probable rRNA maturation factor
VDADPGSGPVILVSDRQDEAVDEEGLVELARGCLAGEGIPDAELSVSFVTEEEMADLHQRYMGEEGATDVLSFPMDEVDEGSRVIGDVVIAPAVAARNNPDRAAEMRVLLVHGILHLLGHDHEREADKAVMWERQALYVDTVPS